MKERLIELAEELLAAESTPVTAEALGMEDAKGVVLHKRRLPLRDGWVEINRTEPAARPPFEWLVEITLALDDAAHPRHYLYFPDGRLMRAVRKELFEPTTAELGSAERDLTELVE